MAMPLEVICGPHYHYDGVEIWVAIRNFFFTIPIPALALVQPITKLTIAILVG